jgi:hypothetical protein
MKGELMAKNLTKDCPSCSDLVVNDDYTYSCKWGKSKKRKVLKDDRVRKTCKLIKKLE